MTNAYILQHNRISTTLSFTARARHYEHYPLVKGNIAPQFFLQSKSKLTNTLQQFDELVSLDELLLQNKPLVLAFYSPVIHKAENLLFFEKLQAILNKVNTNLVILTNSENLLSNKVRRSVENLQIYKDKKNAISASFGLYDAQNPLWNWVPGIESNYAFLPAFYVIGTNKEIVYHHVDYNFSFFNQSSDKQEAFINNIITGAEIANFKNRLQAAS